MKKNDAKMNKHIFDVNNLNDNNYYYFDEGNPVFVIIYPLLKFEEDMIEENQLNYLRKFQEKKQILLLNEESMYSFITKKLATKIIHRLENNEIIRFAFSKQEKEDVKNAYENLKKVEL